MTVDTHYRAPTRHGLSVPGHATARRQGAAHQRREADHSGGLVELDLQRY